MSDDRPPIERAVDLLVYAPIGLVLTAREELPRLIDRGRSEAEGQMGMARVVGEFAVKRGQKEAEKLLQRATQHLAELGLLATPRGGAEAGPASQPPPGPAPAPPPPPAGSVPPAPPEEAPAPTPPSVASLAIPGYDSLSAPQVVQRLAGLSAEELEAVRAYEAATRGRKTILSRVAQLQSVAT